MNRRPDIQQSVELLRRHVTFDKDVKVHVFETIIRVLGGLLSGHALISRDRSLVPGYDGLLLRMVCVCVCGTKKLWKMINYPRDSFVFFPNAAPGCLLC